MMWTLHELWQLKVDCGLLGNTDGKKICAVYTLARDGLDSTSISSSHSTPFTRYYIVRSPSQDKKSTGARLKSLPISVSLTRWSLCSHLLRCFWHAAMQDCTCCTLGYMGVSKNRGGPPKWMVKIMENPMNKWMIWGAHPYIWKHPYC